MRATLATVVLAVLLAQACQGPVPQPDLDVHDGGRRDGVGPVADRSEDGRATFVRRIDGNVQLTFRGEITASEPQWGVLTGASSGRDQGSLLVLSASGELLARHRVSGDAPGGRHQLAIPSERPVVTHTVGGRRFVILTTAPVATPYSLEILEAVSHTQLVTRYRFWNPGSIHSDVVAADNLVAFHALNNTLRPDDASDEEYPLVVGVVDLARLAPADSTVDPIDAQAPARGNAGVESAGHSYLAYFVLPELIGPRAASPQSLSIEGGNVTLQMEGGLRYVLAASDGSAVVEAPTEFRDRYALARRSNPSLPTVEALLAERQQQVRSLPPAQ